MTADETRKMLNEQLLVRLWPEAGRALGLTRGQAYRGAAAGDIKTIDIGKRKRVTTSWLRHTLGLDQIAAS